MENAALPTTNRVSQLKPSHFLRKIKEAAERRARVPVLRRQESPAGPAAHAPSPLQRSPAGASAAKAGAEPGRWSASEAPAFRSSHGALLALSGKPRQREEGHGSARSQSGPALPVNRGEWAGVWWSSKSCKTARSALGVGKKKRYKRAPARCLRQRRREQKGGPAAKFPNSPLHPWPASVSRARRAPCTFSGGRRNTLRLLFAGPLSPRSLLSPHPHPFPAQYGKGSGEQRRGAGQPFAFLQPLPVRNHLRVHRGPLRR